MKRQVSPEVAKKVQRARAAFSLLHERHHAWIVGAALEHFVEAIERTERDIVRNERFQTETLYDPFGGERDRQHEVARDTERRSEYVAIVRFLRALNDARQQASVEGFARDLAESGFFGKG